MTFCPHAHQSCHFLFSNLFDLEKSQPDSAAAKLVAFAGIFDGHDGDKAAIYCAQGLLHHILAETEHCAAKLHSSSIHKSKRKDNATSVMASDGNHTHKDINIQVLKQGHMNGFIWAQTRFGSGSDPPTFRELKLGPISVRNSQSFFKRIFCAPQREVRGGTTASTISLVSLP